MSGFEYSISQQQERKILALISSLTLFTKTAGLRTLRALIPRTTNPHSQPRPITINVINWIVVLYPWCYLGRFSISCSQIDTVPPDPAKVSEVKGERIDGPNVINVATRLVVAFEGVVVLRCEAWVEVFDCDSSFG